jgi:hypothetical protein
MKSIFASILVVIGILAIIFGEADDSPGLQGLGLILVMVVVVICYRRRKSKN